MCIIKYAHKLKIKFSIIKQMEALMDIGKKIRQLRLQNDLTLEDLASRSELTKGFLSQLERNLTSPSISTLEDILEALGTSLSEFFHEEEEEQIVFTQKDFFVDTQDEYQIEWIVPNAQKNEMEPILLTLPPKGKSHEMVSHLGEEFGYVLKGSVTLVRDNKKYKLTKKELTLCANIDFSEDKTDKFEIEMYAEADGEKIEFDKIQELVDKLKQYQDIENIINQIRK